MRAVVIGLTIVIGGTLIGGAVGGAIGWQIGSLLCFRNETARAAYLAGEFVSEDVVPRAAITWFGGFFGCFVGFCEGVGVLAHRQRRVAIGSGVTASPDVRQPSITLFD